jgi:hypothetical protein
MIRPKSGAEVQGPKVDGAAIMHPQAMMKFRSDEAIRSAPAAKFNLCHE